MKKLYKLKTLPVFCAMLFLGFVCGCNFWEQSDETPQVKRSNVYEHETDAYSVTLPDGWDVKDATTTVKEFSARFFPAKSESKTFPVIEIFVYKVKTNESLEDIIKHYQNEKLSQKYPDTAFSVEDFYFGNERSLVITFDHNERHFNLYNIKFGNRHYVLSCEATLEDYPYYNSLFQSFTASFKRFTPQDTDEK
jgi:hypothetical protein